METGDFYRLRVWELCCRKGNLYGAFLSARVKRSFQVSDFREDVRPRERNPGSAGGVRANKECILNQMFAQREPKRSLEAETGKQASDFREDVRSGKRSPASLATGGRTRSSF